MEAIGHSIRHRRAAERNAPELMLPEEGAPTHSAESAADETPELIREEEPGWQTPPFQPIRGIASLALTALAFGGYQWVRLNFWSSDSLGIHDRIPWPAYVLLATSLIVALIALGLALSLRSPHAKLGFSLLAFLAAIAIGVGGGRFVSYTLRGTLNPPFKVGIAVGDRFPAFTLVDQKGGTHRGAASGQSKATLIYVYRGDFCPFARHEVAELNALRPELQGNGVDVIAVSADPVERSKMLSGYLQSDLPLLSDEHETLLGPLGLVQRHRNGEPDNAIPAFFVVDRNGVVKWIFTSPYYRELPRSSELVAAGRSVAD
jgi:peroxiredoxin